MKTVVLIGYGAIAHMVVDELAKDVSEIRIGAVLVRENRVETARRQLPDSIRVVTTVPDLLAGQPDVVVECAGQGAVREYADAVLAAGIDLMVIATGAFANAGLLDDLTERAKGTGARILVPAGAIAGIDGLTALRVGGLDRVRYISAKPPRLGAVRRPRTVSNSTS